MSKFNFEKNLPHQITAVESVIKVFENLAITPSSGTDRHSLNPQIIHKSSENNYLAYQKNLRKVQQENQINQPLKADSHIIDIMMETGTGKTYTYVKTLFALNQHYGIHKFIVIVPAISIKAGTESFLRASKEHFRINEKYEKTIRLHTVSSQNKKQKKTQFPSALSAFIGSKNVHNNKIDVLLINAGMLNSETMHKAYDKQFFEKFNIPIEGLAALKPLVIIDEPHRFKQSNKTWENIKKLNAQYILRYGATFPEKEETQKGYLGKKETIKIKDYHNLIYTLNAVNAFNQNLVKGVISHITEFEEGKNTSVSLSNCDGKEASFKLLQNKQEKTIKLLKNESLSKIHQAMDDLTIHKLNKTQVELSNGLILHKEDKINPYSYVQTIQEQIIKKAIENHFILEKKLIAEREHKIKPLTLFFIDNIDEYRHDNGYIKILIEQLVKSYLEEALKDEKDSSYRDYLTLSLKNISATHGGYFSKDNSEQDEKIEKEVNEILHDKESLLDFANPRRFIFSKWTLREGWDNPNVFQICKLRSSGSDISKLQEVGRGLRLPVNEYGNRVKDEQFYLNYFVDFTESDFVYKLIDEINTKSGAIKREDEPKKYPEKLTQKTIDLICQHTHRMEEDLLKELDQAGIITRSNKYQDKGYEYICDKFPFIFERVGSDKIRTAGDSVKTINIRQEKYAELKQLWEQINQKVVLQYRADEEKFSTLLTGFFKQLSDRPHRNHIYIKAFTMKVEDSASVHENKQSIEDTNSIAINTMLYSDFLSELAQKMHINIKTLHHAIQHSPIDIDKHLNQQTIREITQDFNTYLMQHAIGCLNISYQKVTNSIHPTKLTDEKGSTLQQINASDIGTQYTQNNVAPNYLFDKLFFDSELEKENIVKNLQEVIVFSKIPKNSIKIPVAGGKSYSPDFAYVLKDKDNSKSLHLIVETKDTDENNLRNEEREKIKYAEEFFRSLGGNIKVQFKTQFQTHKITELIKDVRSNSYNH